MNTVIDDKKVAVAQAAVAYLNEENAVDDPTFSRIQNTEQQVTRPLTLGIGAGTTVEVFLRCLYDSTTETTDHYLKRWVLAGKNVVCASHQSARIATSLNFNAHSINSGFMPSVYIDGADWYSSDGILIKGGGGAMTRETLLAETADFFICIAGPDKERPDLTALPIPISALPVAQKHIEMSLAQHCIKVSWRYGKVTEEGLILGDVRLVNTNSQSPTPPTKPPITTEAFERILSSVSGIVESGLFTRRRPDLFFVSDEKGSIRSFSP